MDGDIFGLALKVRTGGGGQEHSTWSWRKEIRIYFKTFSWLLELMGHTCAIGRKLQNKTIYFLNPWINPAHDNLQNGSYLLTKFTVFFFVLAVLEVKYI